jgi:hypothetical protein
MKKISDTINNRNIYINLAAAPASENMEFNLSKLKAEYDREGKEIASWNIFSGGGIGASIGLIACLASTVVGIPISSLEIMTIVVGSLLFGVVAAFILY